MSTRPPRSWHDTVFFGLHYDLHASAQDTELGAALTPEHLRAELEKIRPDWVQCDCKGHAGWTSWPTRVGSTSPGVVHDALRIHRDVTRAMGIPLVMHYSGVWDSRAIELHPDWACVGPPGTATGKEGFVTGGTCNLSPYTDELMIPQLLELIDNYDVDGFWVDGENWATKACYCARCTTAFTAETGITDIPATATEPHWAAWADFHRRIFAEHVRKYTAAVHARKPACTVCSNWMYTVGHPEPIDVPVDYLSGDFAWVWGLNDAELEGRFIAGRGLSWDLMAWGFTNGEGQMGGWTYKPVAGLCQEVACVMALGGAVEIYSTPQRDGHLTGWQQDILAEVARFARARQPWCQGTTAVPQAAVLHAVSHYYPHNGENLMAKWSSAHFPILGAMHALLENGCAVDVLSEEGLLARLDAYPLVVIPEQTHLPAALRDALAAYVAGGGRLLLSGETVAADFPTLAGVQADGAPVEGYFYLPVGAEATIVKGPRQPVAVDGAETLHAVLARQEPAVTTGAPAITRHAVGQGRVVAVHAPLFAHFAQSHYPRTRALVGELLDALAPNLLVEMDAPARLHLALCRQGERLIAHLVNMGTAHPTSPSQVMVEEVPPVGSVTLRVKTPTRPARVYLAPRMEGLCWDWAAGMLTIRVQSVGILESVVIE